MSVASECPACMLGNHKKHDYSHGLIAGVLGGQHCACNGDCAEKFKARSEAFMRIWGSNLIEETVQQVPRAGLSADQPATGLRGHRNDESASKARDGVGDE